MGETKKGLEKYIAPELRNVTILKSVTHVRKKTSNENKDTAKLHELAQRRRFAKQTMMELDRKRAKKKNK